MIDLDPTDLAERTAAGCECPVNDEYACIRGNVYGPCDSDYCGGVCTLDGRCSCPLHSDSAHNSGYGGTFVAGQASGSVKNG